MPINFTGDPVLMPEAVEKQYQNDPRLALALKLAAGKDGPAATKGAALARALTQMLGGYQAGSLKREYEEKAKKRADDRRKLFAPQDTTPFTNAKGETLTPTQQALADRLMQSDDEDLQNLGITIRAKEELARAEAAAGRSSLIDPQTAVSLGLPPGWYNSTKEGVKPVDPPKQYEYAPGATIVDPWTKQSTQIANKPPEGMQSWQQGYDHRYQQFEAWKAQQAARGQLGAAVAGQYGATGDPNMIHEGSRIALAPPPMGGAVQPQQGPMPGQVPPIQGGGATPQSRPGLAPENAALAARLEADMNQNYPANPNVSYPPRLAPPSPDELAAGRPQQPTQSGGIPRLPPKEFRDEAAKTEAKWEDELLTSGTSGAGQEQASLTALDQARKGYVGLEEQIPKLAEQGKQLLSPVLGTKFDKERLAASDAISKQDRQDAFAFMNASESNLKGATSDRDMSIVLSVVPNANKDSRLGYMYARTLQAYKSNMAMQKAEAYKAWKSQRGGMPDRSGFEAQWNSFLNQENPLMGYLVEHLKPEELKGLGFRFGKDDETGRRIVRTPGGQEIEL